MAALTDTKCRNALLVVEDISIRWGERLVFPRFSWTWRRGEQWAILGPNGSGKSLLALALSGRLPLARGEIRYLFDATDDGGADMAAPEHSVALLSPHIQRELATQESSFYQSRWHSGISEGWRTVARFLARASVEDINPFEIGGRRGDRREYQENRRRICRWLGIEHLFRRKLVGLSNGEQRRVLLAHTLLRRPQLLILDDPFGGLDRATRLRLQRAIHRLMRNRVPVLLLTSRPDELPVRTSHVLLVHRHRIIARGPRRRMLRHPLVRQLRRSRLGAGVLNKTPSAADREGPPARLSRRQGRGPGAGGRRDGRSAPLVEMNQVTVRLGRKRILDRVTWTMRAGESWVLLGPNGSGKTALLSLIQGDNPQAYALDIRIFGVRPRSTQTLWHMRQQIGWLSPELHLHYPPGWSCLEVVCSGYFNTVGLYQPCTARQRTTARGWLRAFGLDARADDAFGDLSLGDQRLLLLARAAVKRPKLLILDEPCQGLDATHRQAVLARTDRVTDRTRAGLIFVTHHPREMPSCITHLLELHSGRVRRMGPLAARRRQ
jgi:molybdate transport system ATP-binding protein